MIRKICVLSISLLCIVTNISCEKDFNDVGSSIVNNTKFETGEVLLDVEIEPIDIDDSNPEEQYKSVRADNIALGTLSEYWLGVYKSDNYKTIEASFVSQLALAQNLKIEDTNPATENGDIDSVFTLDKVILKLPYISTNIGDDANGNPLFRLDSVLGNPDVATAIKVFKNNTFLNILDPNNPANANSFQSNQVYEEEDLLNENATSYEFIPSAIDTALVITRNIANGDTYEDVIRLETKAPFIAIPLDSTYMKTNFWDKFNSQDFSSTEAFSNYFRGLIVKAEGSDGAMVPLNLVGNNTSATLDFHYTITTYEKQEGQDVLVFKEAIPSTFSFPLSGVRNSIYKMSPATTAVPANNFVVQGTAGTMARVKILDNTKLNELIANNWLINDASLSFYVNQFINLDKNIVPQQLFLYQEKINDAGNISPTQLTDAYLERDTYGGRLEVSENDVLEKYTFRITDYITKLLNREENITIDPLILKVYNSTDAPSNNISVPTYNWNPRGITLLDGNEANGEKRAVLKISYSKEK